MTRTHGATHPPRPETGPDPIHALTLRLSRPLAARLNLAALATGRPASDIIRTALAEHLTELEANPAHHARYDELRTALTRKDQA